MNTIDFWTTNAIMNIMVALVMIAVALVVIAVKLTEPKKKPHRSAK